MSEDDALKFTLDFEDDDLESIRQMAIEGAVLDLGGGIRMRMSLLVDNDGYDDEILLSLVEDDEDE